MYNNKWEQNSYVNCVWIHSGDFDIIIIINLAK